MFKKFLYYLFVITISQAFVFCMIVAFSSCTYNISMAHTEGMATDTIDDTQSNTPNVSPNLNVPLKI